MKGSSQKQRNVFEERLLKGEEVVSAATISNGIYWKPFAVLLIAIVFAIVFAVELGAVIAVAGILMFVRAVLLKQVFLLVVTNKRLMARYGLLQVDVVDIQFSKIESMELERMLPGYLLGYASVVIMGTGNRLIVIPYVENGVELRRAYNELTLEEE